MQSVGGGLTDYSKKEEGFVSRVAGVAGEVYTIVGTAVKREAELPSAEEPAPVPAPSPATSSAPLGERSTPEVARASAPQSVLPRDPSVAAPAVDASVMEAQELLTTLGYDVGRPDGIIGRRTASALRQFQTSTGLPPSGTINAPTLNALRNSAADGGRSVVEAPAIVKPAKEPERARGSLSNL